MTQHIAQMITPPPPPDRLRQTLARFHEPGAIHHLRRVRFRAAKRVSAREDNAGRQFTESNALAGRLSRYYFRVPTKLTRALFRS